MAIVSFFFFFLFMKRQTETFRIGRQYFPIFPSFLLFDPLSVALRGAQECC